MQLVLYLLAAVFINKVACIDWTGVKPGYRYLPSKNFHPSKTERRLDKRIVGGQEVEPHSFPFMAQVIGQTSDHTRHFCGGSIISQNYVLTAGHCIYECYLAKIIFGAPSAWVNDAPGVTQIQESKKLTCHEGFNPETLEHDIAVIHLAKPLIYSASIAPVRLPSAEDDYNRYVGWSVTIAGWGKTSDNQQDVTPTLRAGNTTVITNYACSKYYEGIGPGQLCVSGEGSAACHGDSGGPLIVATSHNTQNYSKIPPLQIGVVSSGSEDGCETREPVVYTRLTKYRQWLQLNTDVTIT